MAVLAKLAGAVTLSEVEQQTQVWYFGFQVVQVFLITTFTSGATAVASQIVSNLPQAVPLLAKNLPKASNFYIAYFILYGVANSAKYLFNVMGLVGIFVQNRFAKTPRKKYDKWMQLTAPSWGSEYPKWTNKGVIAISYAVIAPLVLGFATVGMGLIYLAYRYNMIYVHNTQVDTKGASYGRAVQQLMVGVYLAELCLLGLFGIGIDDRATAVGPVVMQVVLIVATVIFYISMRRKLNPLIETLPLNLLAESEKRADRDAVNTAERGEAMHPGFESTNGPAMDGMRGADGGLVSGCAADHVAGCHVQAVPNDLAQRSLRPPKQSLLMRLLMPQTQSAVELSASLDARFRLPGPAYSVGDAREACLHPAITTEPPVIWLARCGLGISRREVTRLRESLGRYGVEVTDEGALVNEKGKVEWSERTVC